MKRSEIINLVRAAERCFAAHGLALPPNARWDVTDFGLALVNLPAEPEYCEMPMYAQGGVWTPAHCHRSIKEDTLCLRGRLAARVSSGRPDEQHRESNIVPVNHEPAWILLARLSTKWPS